MAKWALALRQTTTYLGLVAIAIIWVGIYLLSSEQRQLAYPDALRQGSNLARVLEEYIRRVVQESDNALLALRQDYQRDPQNFDLASFDREIARWARKFRPRSGGCRCGSV